ncbi:leucyl/phenylalanyl-tRNA--protein transferase [[Leptolyngbya] sp. PCC 7376]|uniref:leucyl/phenylalanyl-tRNA--protein transferase n=1 Tax=[Leptolyngbya] sp. PCC 7376 TaxID=111781 RepID=UPI00029F0A61|nr:leucyl/phenylalanyl-tRNA--protein transferase [[Leptolyngbya] sp. PCC 7376]AFY37876.1 leucyl/phenylalanyl-tRNA--protein transferase [[Leptolyngbya] sp. PCC 7376]
MKWIDGWYPVILDRGLLPHVPQLVEHRNGEFCVALDLEPGFIAEACAHGYMPMGEIAQDRPILLIKSHQKRCILDFENLHISRKIKRYARTLTFHIDRNFSECLNRVVIHYHPDTWLIKPLCDALISLHKNPMVGVSFHSIEIYDGDNFVAGEIGYTTGAIYTSLAGFHSQNGSGSVQLAVLGLILAESEFAFWDLGMPIPYKESLGAIVINRETFLKRWKTDGDRPTPTWSALTLDTDEILQKLKRNKR